MGGQIDPHDPLGVLWDRHMPVLIGHKRFKLGEYFGGPHHPGCLYFWDHCITLSVVATTMLGVL